LSIAGSVNLLVITNDAQAIVQDKVKINQNAEWRDNTLNPSPNQGAEQSDGKGEQVVSVEATNYLQLINVTGNFQFKLPSITVDPLSPDWDLGVDIAPLGSESKRGGFGGSIYLSFLTNTTKALVEGEAEIYSGADGGFNMKAEEAIFDFGFTQSGANAGKAAVAGSFAYLDQHSTNLAQLSRQAVVTGRSVNLYAGSLETQVNWVGGVAFGDGLGVGVSVGINDVHRDTFAVIGDPLVRASNGGAGNTPANNIDVDGQVNLRAAVDGFIMSFAVAGAKVSTELDKPAVPQNVPLKAQNVLGTDLSPPPTGIGVAAAVSFNDVTDNTQASIEDAGLITADDVVLLAVNDLFEFTLTGGLSFVSGPSQKSSYSLAGAFSWNELDTTTRAS